MALSAPFAAGASRAQATNPQGKTPDMGHDAQVLLVAKSLDPVTIAELRDRTYAECCQLMSEYDPHPPFIASRNA